MDESDQKRQKIIIDVKLMNKGHNYVHCKPKFDE